MGRGVPRTGVSCLATDGGAVPAGGEHGLPHGPVHGARQPRPHSDRGPAKAYASRCGPGASATTHTASVGVPEQSCPLSTSAWTLASVAVATAFTRAASVSAAGTATTTLIVPGSCTPAAPSRAGRPSRARPPPL